MLDQKTSSNWDPVCGRPTTPQTLKQAQTGVRVRDRGANGQGVEGLWRMPCRSSGKARMTASMCALSLATVPGRTGSCSLSAWLCSREHHSAFINILLVLIITCFNLNSQWHIHTKAFHVRILQLVEEVDFKNHCGLLHLGSYFCVYDDRFYQWKQHLWVFFPQKQVLKWWWSSYIWTIMLIHN